MQTFNIRKILCCLLFCIFANVLLTNSVFAQNKETAQKKPGIAVLPFVDSNKQAREQEYGEAISGMMTTGIINGAIFRVMERSEIEHLMKEQAFQLSGAVNSETAKRIGELYAIDFLLFGTVAKFGALIETDIRLVDTETGEAILAENANAQSSGAVRSMVQELVRKIENRYRLKINPPKITTLPVSPKITPLPVPPTTSQGTGRGPSSPPPTATEGMVLIQGGQFAMGNAATNAPWNEIPQHVVQVNAFYLDVTEVTNAQYRQFIEATGHPAPKYWNNTRNNKPNQPAVGVTWNDAVKYAAWAGKRLPTEAEWEYAARGNLPNSKFPWGDASAAGKAWFGKPIMSGTATNVASFEVNGFGLYDMAGNVGEWCADWFRDDAYRNTTAINPTGPAQGSLRTVRGGAFYEDAYFLRCSARKGMGPGSYSRSIGFRCARTAQ